MTDSGWRPGHRPSAIRTYVEALLAGPRPLPIVVAGDPVLRTPATPYDGQLDDLLGPLLHAMRVTMHAAPGVGLAAPQIGVGLALAVVEDTASIDPELRQVRERPPLGYRTLINPAYTPAGDTTVAFYEGCLSVPGYAAVRARYRQVRLTGHDADGRAIDDELTGWPARIVQHETDHLRGELYLDRAEPRSLSAVEHLVERWNQPTPEEAAAALAFGLDGPPA